MSSIRAIMRASTLGPSAVLGPGLLAMLAALFEGFGTGLLIPFLKGFIDGDFAFLRERRMGRLVLDFLPDNVQNDNKALFLLILSAVILTTLIRIWLSYKSNILFAERTRYGLHKLRCNLFDRLMLFGKSFFDQSKLGELANTVLKVTEQITHYANILHSVVLNFFMLIAYVTLMCFISWELVLLVIALVPVYYFSTSRSIRNLQRSATEYGTHESKLSNFFYDIVGNVELVTLKGRQKQESEEFAAGSNASYVSSYRQDSDYLLLGPIQELAALGAAIVMTIFIFFVLIHQPARDVSGLLVFLYLLKRSTTTMRALGDVRGMLAQVSGFGADVAALLDPELDRHIIPNGQTTFPGLVSEISVEHLTFSYDNGVTVLKDVSATFEHGKLTALVGPSGSGKTTLVNILLRLYDCPPGTVYVDGVDIREFDQNSLRSRIALVSQNTSLFNGSLRSNLAYGLTDVSDEQLMEALQKAHLDEFVSSIPEGLDTVLGDRGVRLSGGQKQRLSIARAILTEPELLILDEATSSLDATTERYVQEALDQILPGRTAIVIAHRFSTLQNADKIITLSNGEVVETGALKELLDSNGLFSTLWKDQELFC